MKFLDLLNLPTEDLLLLEKNIATDLKALCNKYNLHYVDFFMILESACVTSWITMGLTEDMAKEKINSMYKLFEINARTPNEKS